MAAECSYLGIYGVNTAQSDKDTGAASGGEGRDKSTSGSVGNVGQLKLKRTLIFWLSLPPIV